MLNEIKSLEWKYNYDNNDECRLLPVLIENGIN